jgi:hypothetical protein
VRASWLYLQNHVALTTARARDYDAEVSNAADGDDAEQKLTLMKAKKDVLEEEASDMMVVWNKFTLMFNLQFPAEKNMWLRDPPTKANATQLVEQLHEKTDGIKADVAFLTDRKESLLNTRICFTSQLKVNTNDDFRDEAYDDNIRNAVCNTMFNVIQDYIFEEGTPNDERSE